jgi:hypothetical protein
VIEGYDIYRSLNIIIALVVVEISGKKDLRLYRWQNRKGQWKVDLCRMSVFRWNWNDVAKKVNELKNKYGLNGTAAESFDM